MSTVNVSPALVGVFNCLPDGILDLTAYGGFKVAPCRDGGGMFDPMMGEPADYWTVYGVRDERLAEAIHEVATADDALRLAFALAGATGTWVYPAFTAATVMAGLVAPG